MQKRVTVFVVMIMALTMTGLTGSLWAGAQRAKSEQERTITVTDRGGNRVTLSGTIERIISTVPSNTEIIAGLGLADKMVAIDRYSLDIEGINQNLPQIDFFYPDAEVIIGLSPDLIITNQLNSVGAGDDPFRLISDSGIPVVYIPTSNTIDGICGDIEFIANILDVKERGDEMVRAIRTQIAEVAAIGSTITDKKTVYFEISPAPYLYSFGTETFLNEMIELIGARNIFADVTGWIAPSAESVIEKNPDVILTNINYTDDPLGELQHREGFENVRAVQNKAIYQIDANSSSRPSHHIIRALKEMAKAIYPDKYAQY